VSVGFIIRCDNCEKSIVETKGFEQDTFNKLNTELGKVTEGFIGSEIGQASIQGYDEMQQLSAFPMLCSSDCAAIHEKNDWLSNIKRFWKKLN